MCTLSWSIPTHKHQQTQRRRPSAPCAPDVGPSGNQAKGVAAVSVALGSESVAVLATPSSATRGTRASRSAKHGLSPREPVGRSHTLRSSSYNPWMLLEWQTLNQASRLPTKLCCCQATRQQPSQSQRRRSVACRRPFRLPRQSMLPAQRSLKQWPPCLASGSPPWQRTRHTPER